MPSLEVLQLTVMQNLLLSKHRKNDPLVSLVATAIDLTDLKDLSVILQSIARSMNCYGCVLWEIAPGSDLTASPPRGHLFVLDQWLEDGRPYYFDDLPIYSAAGKTVMTQETINIDNVETDSRVSADPRYLRRLGVKALLSVPIIFTDGSRRGAILFYRKTPEPFSDEEIALGEQLGLLVPPLYQTIRVKNIYGVTRRVEQILNKAKQQTHSKEFSERGTKSVIARALRQICDFISESFQCIETSVFLEDPLTEPGDYQLIATTWPIDVPKKTYHKEQKSLTGWVLFHRRPVKIFDLANFQRDKRTIQQQYRNIGWTDSLDIKNSIMHFLDRKDSSTLPPLSFMAAPIVMGDRVLGVIRCCTAKKGPYYFAEADLNLLELVATQISQYWSDWLNEMEMQEENRSWASFTEKIGKLNNYVLKELASVNPNEKRIMAEALRITRAVVKDAEIMDVRLVDETTNELFFFATDGDDWNKGSIREVANRKAHRFSVGSQPPTSAGAHVMQTRQTYSIPDITHRGSFYSEQLTFPGVKRMIVAPLKVESEIFGVLDIRGTGKKGFPRNAEAIADLLGVQLGLYHYLAKTVGKLHKVELDLEAQAQERIQTLEDLAHQIKGPIYQAHERIQSVLRATLSDERLENSLLAIRGLARKSKRVTMSTMLYSALARNKHIQPKPELLDYAYLIRMLIEAASDNSLMIDPRRRLNIQVDRKSFEIVDQIAFEADRDLLEQAVNNLLDNAGKYSFENTVIDVYGGITATGRFHVTVENEGLPLSSVDIQNCVKRGWRSDLAKWTTGEGSGIGLWIVDSIMIAQKGSLVIIPTDAESKTQIKLIIPKAKDESEG